MNLKLKDFLLWHSFFLADLLDLFAHEIEGLQCECELPLFNQYFRVFLILVTSKHV